MLPIWLAPLALLAPVLFTGQALFWGTPYLQFVPWRMAAWEALKSGQLPLWNPLVGMGAPLIANYQSALFYPPNWLQFALAAVGGIGWLAWGQALLVALHLAWAGWGTWLLARRLGMGPLARIVSGLAFSLCGYLVARAGFLSINAAVAWLPWILLASAAIAPFPRDGVGESRRPYFLRILPLALCIGLQLLAGHAQTAWYTLLLLAAWVAFWGWRNGGWRTMAVSLVQLAAPVLIGTGLAAVQLLPTAEYLLQSQRSSAVDYTMAVNYSFWPWQLITLLAPDFFGNPAQGNYWVTANNYWEDAIYVGLLPAILAFSALIGLFSRRSPAHQPKDKRLIGFLGSVILVAFLLALGKNTPIFPFLYHHVPTFALFQAPARFTLWAEFALALLAGLGVSAWRRPGGKGLYWTRLATAGAVAVSLGAGLGWYFLRGVDVTFIRATAIAGFWGLGVGVLSLTAPKEAGTNPPRAWFGGVVLLVCADLLVAGWGLNPGVGQALYTQAATTQAEVSAQLAGGRLYLSQGDEQHIKFVRFFQFDSFHPYEGWQDLRDVYLPDGNMLDGIPSANNFDPLVPGRYARWTDYLEVADFRVRSAMLAAMDVGATEQIDDRYAYGVRFEPVAGASRLSWFTCADFASDGNDAWNKALQRFSGDAQESGRIILEGGNPGENLQPCALSSQAKTRIMEEDSNRVVVQVESDATGWLEMADVWYPGWVVSIDGKPASILRADYLFRAVAVPAGTHTIEWIYRPTSFYLGAAISGSVWLGLAALVIWRKLSKRTPNPGVKSDN